MARAAGVGGRPVLSAAGGDNYCMSLRTPFTELLSVQHPIVLAPMGGSAGGALAAAVSNAGGLGLVGGGQGERDWLDRELALVTERAVRPWGIADSGAGGGRDR